MLHFPSLALASTVVVDYGLGATQHRSEAEFGNARRYLRCLRL
jgi:hypothetical protein